MRIRWRVPFTFEPDSAPPRWLLWVAQVNAHAAAIRAVVRVVAEDHERSAAARAMLLAEARRLCVVLQGDAVPNVSSNVLRFARKQ